MIEKVSKAEANYRSGAGRRRCQYCTMFVPPKSCTAVKGDISPQAVCDYFKAEFGEHG